MAWCCPLLLQFNTTNKYVPGQTFRPILIMQFAPKPMTTSKKTQALRLKTQTLGHLQISESDTFEGAFKAVLCPAPTSFYLLFNVSLSLSLDVLMSLRVFALCLHACYFHLLEPVNVTKHNSINMFT